MIPRSVGGISLRPKNNRGPYYFMSLKTGIIIHAGQWTVPNVTKLVIDKVEKLATDDGIYKMVYGEMIFEWDTGDQILLQPDYEDTTPPFNYTNNE